MSILKPDLPKHEAEQNPAEFSDDFSREDEQHIFEDYFRIDPEKDKDLIKQGLMRVGKRGNFYSKYDSGGGSKYTQEQIEAGEYDTADFEMVRQELREEKIKEFFMRASNSYEVGRAIIDSIVRLDDEASIIEQMESGKPVLIRGFWRQGKTSMLFSIMTHKYGRDGSICLDVSSSGRDSLDELKEHLGVYEIASLIAKHESVSKEHDLSVEGELRKKIRANGKNSFEYLNDWLREKGKVIFLSFDEMIAFSGRPEVLEYFAGLKNLSNIRLAIVLHRFHDSEDKMMPAFSGFEEHYIRPLTLEEVGKLVREPIKDMPIRFTKEAIQLIYEFTGGRPIEVQAVCHTLIDPYSKLTKQEPGFIFRAEDVRKLMDEETWTLRREGFDNIMANFQRVFEHGMSDEERSVVTRLVDGNISIGEVAREVVKSLVDTGFAVREAGDVLKINGSLFKKVIKQYLADKKLKDDDTF